jgi:hypothetical protein
MPTAAAEQSASSTAASIETVAYSSMINRWTPGARTCPPIRQPRLSLGARAGRAMSVANLEEFLERKTFATVVG